MTKFKAFIVEAVDTSDVIETRSTWGGGSKSVGFVKSAAFTIRTDGPCPWPPNQIIGSQVVVIPKAEFDALMAKQQP